MKNITFAILASVIGLIFAGSATSQPQSDINAKVAQLDMGKATLDDVVRIFGEPEKYMWNNETFTKDNLPPVYTAKYPGGFSVFMSRGKVDELRFDRSSVGYVFRGKLKMGSSLDEVLEVLGQSKETVVGQPMGQEKEDTVLYKDMSGTKGHCYYSRKDKGIRLFFLDYKVVSLYLTSTAQRGPSETGKASKDSKLQRLEPVESVEEFDDIRSKDLSKLDLSKRKKLIQTLQFNQKTIWPAPEKMPVGVGPNQLLTGGMNPGLGVRDLHHQGITGKGINVAIIDQPMYLDHPEFAGKIAAYYDTGCGEESSMHGPAVTSLLVGTNCGTAPNARVYYAAAPSWKKDTAYEAKAMDWIIQQNEKLPVSEKIRVVSVSAAPTSPHTRDKNRHMWEPARRRAEAAGIMVLDCTTEYGFAGTCWYNSRVPESVAGCTPGHPKEGAYFSPDSILAPAWGRTIAEEEKKGDFGYIYGRGGESWTTPYCAGVLALGWQIRPELTPDQMRELLFESAYTNKDGAKIIDPEKFIRLVKKAKVATPTRRH